MNSISVFSCIPLPEHVMAAMQDAFHFVVAAPGDQIGQLNRRTAAGEHFDAVLTGLGADLLDAKSIAALPSSIRIIATYSAGTDHIDLDAARAKGIAVSNTR
jgi:lactate dehydrogenase-like 2-hydroxyacid dehydrogenase